MHMQFDYFDSFPYLNTRVGRGLFHLEPLPATASLEELKLIAEVQVSYNRLDACLVIGPASCIYFDRDGTVRPSTSIPSGGINFAGQLLPCGAFRVDRDVHQRLREFVELRREAGYVFGDLTKGGRSATEEELGELAGFQHGGVPYGLERCGVCGDWRGQCLDPSPEFRGMVMQVRCLCQNDTRCARCGHPFADRAVNANYYDGKIWHVPGLAALKHKCRIFRIGKSVVRGALIPSSIDVSIEERDGQWVLHVKGEDYCVAIGPMETPDLIEQLRARDCRLRPFVAGLRRFGETKLDELAGEIEAVVG
jgi:hypothetical protein